MQIRAVGITLDSNDPERTADFWQAAIGFETRFGDGHPFVTLSDSPVPRPIDHLTIQRVPEPKSSKHRMHLDLFVSDSDAEVARLVELGAVVVTPEHVAVDGIHVTVLADPDGGEFCVVHVSRSDDSL
jgi:predicted enzyme related to lactoylglutathione lyase